MWVRRLAAAAALLTLCLIVAGGLVTNTDSGLACPDWPLCYGSPLPRMVGGVAVEHTHRLIATSVGLCAVGLCFGLLSRRRAMLLCGAILPVLLAGAFAGAWLRQRGGEFPAWAIFLVALGFAAVAAVAAQERGPGRLATVALALVVAQGLLGGLTVVYRLPPTVLVLHTATSMLFLASVVALAWRLSGRPAGTWTAKPLSWMTAGAVYVQIVLGAAVRHTGAGLVCVDLPYCRGALWPTGVHPSVHLHMAHRAFAFVVLGLVVANAAAMWRARGTIRALALAGPLLVLAQIVLGILTIVTFKGLVPVTAHLLVAALLFADLVSILALAKPQPGRVAEEAPVLGAAT